MEKEGTVEVVALVDPSPERRAVLGKCFPSARQHQALAGMLSGEVPVLAIVGAPHRHHADLSIACLHQGIHVLCEKPMALTTTECDMMIAAAEESRRILAVGYIRRFFPSCRVIKKALDSNMLGPVRSFRFLDGRSFTWPAQSASFFRRSDAGGGVLIDAGAHTVDLLIWWLGDAVETQYADDAMGGVESNCTLRLTLAGGAQGVVQLSRDWPLPSRYVVECERGWIAHLAGVADRIEWGLFETNYGLAAEIRSMAAPSATTNCNLDGPVPDFKACLGRQLRNVLAAIRGEEPLEVPGREARRSIALIQECYRSRRLLPMPWLDETERRRAEELSHA